MQTLFDRLVSEALYKDLDGKTQRINGEKFREKSTDREVELDKQLRRLEKQKKILGNSIKRLKDILGQTNSDFNSIDQDIRLRIKRDLEWLMNSYFFCPSEELINAKLPNVASSVLNYGIPDFTDQTLSELNKAQFANQLRQIVIMYEPRIIPETLIIKSVEEQNKMNIISFEIQGELSEEELQVQLRTDFELEKNKVRIHSLD